MGTRQSHNVETPAPSCSTIKTQIPKNTHKNNEPDFGKKYPAEYSDYIRSRSDAAECLDYFESIGATSGVAVRYETDRTSTKVTPRMDSADETTGSYKFGVADWIEQRGTDESGQEHRAHEKILENQIDKHGDQLTLNTTKRADIDLGTTESIRVKQTHLEDRWLDLVNVSDYERDSDTSSPTTVDGANAMATTRPVSTTNCMLNSNENFGVNVSTDPDNIYVYVEGALVKNPGINTRGKAIRKVNPKSSEKPERVDESHKVTTYPRCSNAPVFNEQYGSQFERVYPQSHTSHKIAKQMGISNLGTDNKYANVSGLFAQGDETTVLADLANCSESGPQDRPHSGHSKLMDRDSMNLDQSESSLSALPTLTHVEEHIPLLGETYVKCKKVGMRVASELQLEESGSKVSRESLIPNDDCKTKIFNTIVTTHPVSVRTHSDSLTTYSGPGTTHVEMMNGRDGLTDECSDLIKRTNADIVRESKKQLTPKLQIYVPTRHESIDCVANVSDHFIATRQKCQSDETLTETMNTGEGTRPKSKQRDKSIGSKDNERKLMKQTSEQGKHRRQTPDRSTATQRSPDRREARQDIPNRSNIGQPTLDWNTGRQQTPDRNTARQQTSDRSKGRQQTPDWNKGRQQTPDRNKARQQTPDRSKGRQRTPDRRKARQQIPNRQQTPDRSKGRQEMPTRSKPNKEEADKDKPREENKDQRTTRRDTAEHSMPRMHVDVCHSDTVEAHESSRRSGSSKVSKQDSEGDKLRKQLAVICNDMKLTTDVRGVDPGEAKKKITLVTEPRNRANDVRHHRTQTAEEPGSKSTPSSSVPLRKKNAQPSNMEVSNSNLHTKQNGETTKQNREQRRTGGQKQHNNVRQQMPTGNHFVEICYPGRITKDHLMRFINQYVSTNIHTRLESHESVGGEMKAVLTLASRRKANQFVSQLNTSNADLKMTAKIIQQPKSIDVAQKLVDDTWDFVDSKAKSPTNFHKQKMADTLENINKLNRAKNLSLGNCGPVFDQIDASQNKWYELNAQNDEISRYMGIVKQKLDSYIYLDVSSDVLKKKLSDIKRQFGLELNKLKAALPMYARKQTIIEHIKRNQVSIILGETGSGKSTQLVQFLDQAGFADKGTIVCTQPRKVAAISLAKRVAQEMGSSMGKLVGWKTGSNHRSSAETKVLYMTDYTLLNECIADSTLSKYSCIIVDEAHERSIYTDLLLGMIKKMLVARPELRVIITSATIDPQVFVEFFQCSDALKVSGRAFPVDVVYDDKDSKDNHMEAAVQKAIDIHRTQPPGDVLVFLTTPIETEKASAMFRKRMTLTDVICLEIHGQQQPSDQEKVFNEAPNGERKVIFATNCAETSITIAGIKYVVDTGLAKEKLYDAKKSMSSLVVGYVSKSSADQRKGRAGRTASGKCYRLFTKTTFENMSSISTPEILRAHLGQSILKLLLLGIADVTDFDFVQSPPREVLLAANDALADIGAIDRSGLTDLGRKLAKLSIEPKLGKLVLDCIAAEVGFEGVIVAALGVVGYNVFYRGKTDEEKQLADKMKVRLCHDRGDIFTYLNIFKEWYEVAENRKNKWCQENCINAKSMRMTRDSMNELLKLLDKELHIKIVYQFSEMSVVERFLPSLLLDCYKINLAYFSGHSSLGYIPIVSKDCRLPVHPGSALQCLKRESKWVIYEQILNTSQQFALNVTCLNEEEVGFEIDLSELEAKVVVPKCVTSIGPTVLREVVWKKFGHPRKAQDAFSEVIKEAGQNGAVALDISKGKFTFYTQKVNQQIVVDYLQTIVLPLKEKMERATEEFAIIERCQVRCVLAAGGVLRTILMPQHARVLTLNDVPIASTKDTVSVFLSQFGMIEDVHVFNQTKAPRKGPVSWGKVIFVDHKSAASALEALVGEEFGYSVSSNVRQSQGVQIECRVHWCRRPLKGFGFVNFEDDDHAAIEAAYTSEVIVNGATVRVSMSTKTNNQLFLRNIPRDTTKQEMANALQAEITSPVKDVALIREKANPTSAKDLDMFKRRIMSHIELKLGTKDGYEVQLRKPRDFDFTMNGTVTFQDSTQAELLTNVARHEELSICNQRVHFDIQLQRLYYIDKEIYAVVGDEIETEVNDIRTEFAEDVVIDEHHLPNGTVRLRLKSSSKDNFTESAMRLNIFIEGTDIDLTDVQHQRFAMSAKGKRALQKIMREEGVFLKYDRWRGSISVFGPVAAVGAAVESVKKVLTELQQVKVQEIELAGDDRPFGVMRELFIRYGISMEQFIEECVLTDVDISVKRHTMSVFGKADAIEKAKSVVDSVADQIRDKTVQIRVAAEACPVCLCDLDDETYRTELCGHSYCRSCIDGMLHHGIKSKDLPFVCTKEKCDKPLVLQDIYNLVGKSREALKPLVDAATEKFVSVNSKEYQFCITPNCPVVYKITKHKSKFICPNERCRIEICTACKARYHEGFSCDMYRGLKTDEDYSLRAWIKQSPQNRAPCPRCGMVIEKNGGCKHMHCKCGAHICWSCKKTFPNELATHNHLARDCGGIGLDQS